jgi:Putative bacterial sensory transduction regulator
VVTVIKTGIMLCAILMSAPVMASDGETNAAMMQNAMEIPIPGPKDLIDASNPKLLASIIDNIGYRAEILTAKDEPPYIRINFGEFNGYLYFKECIEYKNCNAVQFSIGFGIKKKPTLEKINSIMDNHRYLTIIIDEEKDPIAWYDMTMQGGVTRLNFEYSVRNFATVAAKLDALFYQ